MGCATSRPSAGPPHRPSASSSTSTSKGSRSTQSNGSAGVPASKNTSKSKSLRERKGSGKVKGGVGGVPGSDSSDSDSGLPPLHNHMQFGSSCAVLGHDANVDELIEFTQEQLEAATGGFSQRIGEGGYGVVFKGSMALAGHAQGVPEGPLQRVDIAVKVLKDKGGEFKSWQNEVKFLGALRHKHLVRLYGYCYEGDDWMLVYEYVPKRSFDKHLYPVTDSANPVAEPPKILSLRERLKVMLGAAKGLTFLHEDCGRSIVYRDFKTANILLDEDFNAKLSDFGLARDGPEGPSTHVSTSGIAGTMGYMAPEYVSKGHVSPKCDTYSFGVVLLEVVSGRRAELDSKVVVWAKSTAQKGKEGWRDIVDPKLGNKFPERAARQAVKAALTCVRPDPHQRPTMRAVVETLTVAYEQCLDEEKDRATSGVENTPEVDV